MPVYEYHCDKCDHDFEVIQKMSDGPLKKCPTCGGSKVHKLLSNSAFHLKGSGWYKTDYAKPGSTGETKKDTPKTETAKPAKTGD